MSSTSSSECFVSEPRPPHRSGEPPCRRRCPPPGRPRAASSCAGQQGHHGAIRARHRRSAATGCRYSGACIDRASPVSHAVSHRTTKSGRPEWPRVARSGRSTRGRWLRRAGAARVLNRRGTAASEVPLPHPARSRGWLKSALLECAECHQIAERRSPAQRHCPECAASLRGSRSREAVARARGSGVVRSRLRDQG